MKQLPQSFFNRPTLQVAQDLLGKIIDYNGLQGRIVETEAYGQDPASHAYTRTERSALMYDTYGHVYVYLIYGMYWCINFTTEKDKPGAVLIRALQPLQGITQMQKNRNTTDLYNLCSGPGKICKAFNITKELNGTEIGSSLKVLSDTFLAPNIVTSHRIGIKDALDLPWRFYLKDNPFVSKVKLLNVITNGE